ncbi:WASH complex subunit 3-like [Penaeus chinensis]|uniref:WASH complex subunit 3-like n=1 Tax=Penaeus chinensis TaxID=139456 RepID=UPI001FB57754|nr:WASH complex subunit 3-like [Penaeus chinensis]
MDRNSVVTPNVDLSKVEAINQKRTLAFINHWVLHTVAFLNQFSSICEERLVSLDTKLRRADHSLAILEAKLSSVPGLEGVVAEAVASPAGPPSTADAAGATEERQAAPDATASPPATQPEGAQQNAVESPEADPAPAAPAVSATPVSKDPRYVPYFKMLAVGVPRPAVEMKMSREGIDPSLLDDPDAPAPPAGDAADEDSDSSSVSSWSD